MKVAIQYQPEFLGMAIYLYEDRPEGRFVVKPVELKMEILDYGKDVEPTFHFDENNGREFLNSFVSALVEAGFKPDEIKAHDKEITATKFHLEDMRKLVFKGK